MKPDNTSEFGPKVLKNIAECRQFTLSLSEETNTMWLEWPDKSGISFTFETHELVDILMWAYSRIHPGKEGA